MDDLSRRRNLRLLYQRASFLGLILGRYSKLSAETSSTRLIWVPCIRLTRYPRFTKAANQTDRILLSIVQQTRHRTFSGHGLSLFILEARRITVVALDTRALAVHNVRMENSTWVNREGKGLLTWENQLSGSPIRNPREFIPFGFPTSYPINDTSSPTPSNSNNVRRYGHRS